MTKLGSFGLLFFVPFFAAADQLGENRSFFVDSSYDVKGRNGVHATLRKVSNKSYSYVEDEYWNSISQNARDQLMNNISLLLFEFDNRIYPIETSFFGSEPNPGVDRDSKITILFTPLIETTGGYFGNAHVYPLSNSNPNSNEREMFFLSLSAVSDPRKINAFLAHEFQHLVSFNQKEKVRNLVDDVWTNEFRSEYAVSLLGYNDNFAGSNLDRRVQSFIRDPSDSLTEWKNLHADYAQIALLAEFIAEHWSEKVIGDSTQNNEIGIVSLIQAFRQNGFSETFQEIFRYWSVANYINDGSKNIRFGYKHEGLKNFRVRPTDVLTNLGDSNTFTVSAMIKDWQARWYEISQFAAGNNNFMKLTFTSPSLTSFEIAYLLYHSDGRIELKTFFPKFNDDTLYIGGINSDINKIVLMPIKQDRLSGFGANENGVSLTFSIDRRSQGPLATPSSTPIISPSPSSLPSLAPTVSPVVRVRPGDFGLKEGDFIRAEGDHNVYIINEQGFKRLVLSPQICLQYGHLGKRGCFTAVKIVSVQVRDAFRTSWYYTNGETHDGKVYLLKETGEDSAILRYITLNGNDFIRQGGEFRSIFLINSREQYSYPSGSPIITLD